MSKPFSFDDLPNTAFIRAAELVRSAKNPTSPLPFSASTLLRKTKAGEFPKPSKLSTRVTAWRVGDVREWLRCMESFTTTAF